MKSIDSKTRARKRPEVYQYVDVIRKKAELLAHIGSYDLAISEVKKILAYTEADLICPRSRIDEAGAYVFLANVYRLKGEIKAGFEVCQRGIEIAETGLTGNDRSEDFTRVMAKGYNNMGALQWLSGQVEMALERYQRSRELSREVKDQQLEGITTNNMGALYFQKGDNKKARECYLSFMRMSRRNGDKRNIAAACNNLGLLLSNQGKKKKALLYFKESLDNYRLVGDKQGLVAAGNNLGIIYKDAGDYDRASGIYINNIEAAHAAGERRGEGQGYCNLGMVHLLQDEYDLAMEQFLQYNKISEEIGFKRGVGIACGNIGGIHFSKGEFQKAEEYYYTQLKIANEINDSNGVVQALINLANLFMSLGERGKTDDYIKQAEASLADKPNWQILLALLALKAEAILKSGLMGHRQLQEASDCLSEMRNLAKAESSEYGWAQSCRLQALYHLLKGEINLAKESIITAQIGYEKLRMRKCLADCLLLDARIASSAGDEVRAKKMRDRANSVYAEIGIRSVGYSL